MEGVDEDSRLLGRLGPGGEKEVARQANHVEMHSNATADGREEHREGDRDASALQTRESQPAHSLSTVTCEQRSRARCLQIMTSRQWREMPF